MNQVQNVYSMFNQRRSGSAERLGWDSEAAQQRNFDTMLDLVRDAGLDLGALSVHDAGCGHGDLIDTLTTRGGVKHYVGTDFMEPALAHARERYPTYSFMQTDLLTGRLPKVDITLCFGALAFHKPRVVEMMLARLWEQSTVALGFISWWNLTPAYMYFDQSEQLRKGIRRFIRTARPKKTLERLGDYGDPVEAMFLLVR